MSDVFILILAAIPIPQLTAWRNIVNLWLATFYKDLMRVPGVVKFVNSYALHKMMYLRQKTGWQEVGRWMVVQVFDVVENK